MASNVDSFNHCLITEGLRRRTQMMEFGPRRWLGKDKRWRARNELEAGPHKAISKTSEEKKSIHQNPSKELKVFHPAYSTLLDILNAALEQRTWHLEPSSSRSTAHCGFALRVSTMCRPRNPGTELNQYRGFNAELRRMTDYSGGFFHSPTPCGRTGATSDGDIPAGLRDTYLQLFQW